MDNELKKQIEEGLKDYVPPKYVHPKMLEFLPKFGYIPYKDNHELTLNALAHKISWFNNLISLLAVFICLGEILRNYTNDFRNSSIIGVLLIILAPVLLLVIFKRNNYKNEYEQLLNQNTKFYENLYQAESILRGFIDELKSDSRLPLYYLSSLYYSGLIKNINNKEQFKLEAKRFIIQYLEDIKSDKHQTEQLCEHFLNDKKTGLLDLHTVKK